MISHKRARLSEDTACRGPLEGSSKRARTGHNLRQEDLFGTQCLSGEIVAHGQVLLLIHLAGPDEPGGPKLSRLRPQAMLSALTVAICAHVCKLNLCGCDVLR